jgi:GNAT superfamily N-acetyltransferase
MADEIRCGDALAAEELEFLDEQIYAFNRAATGFHDGRALAAFVRDEAGTVRAGLAGHTWGGCCEIRFLWVREDARRSGLGGALLEAAEREARARGCERVVLATHSFQAPAFYARRGYTECGRADGYPRGHAQIYLTKSLAGGDAVEGGASGRPLRSSR